MYADDAKAGDRDAVGGPQALASDYGFLFRAFDDTDTGSSPQRYATTDFGFLYRAFDDTDTGSSDTPQYISEATALELVDFVAWTCQDYDWTCINADMEYGRGGLLFLAVVRRWPKVCSVLIDLMKEPLRLNRAFFRVECGARVIDVTKENVVQFIIARAWNHDPRIGDVDDTEFNAVQYGCRWPKRSHTDWLRMGDLSEQAQT